MLSLKKFYSCNQTVLNYLAKIYTHALTFKDREPVFFVEPKVDGVAFAAVYNEGLLVSARTWF